MSKLNDNLRWAKNGHSHSNTSQIKNSYPTQSSTKSDGRVLEKMQHTTDQNTIECFNTHPETLQGFNNNSLTANLNVINDISNFSNCSQTLTEPDVLNSTQNLGTSNCITEPWREINYVYEMKHAWLTYLNYSMTSRIIPSINFYTISNPFVQIPTEVSRLASNDLNKTELFCRKRTETAVIRWMLSKLKTFIPLRTCR